jgi:hypothetical protein
MDLSCESNRLNERFPMYLMPGEELNETPEGDTSECHHKSSRVKIKLSGSSAD